MPKKTHASSTGQARGIRSDRLLFELRRRAIVERGVEPTTIVVLLDERGDVGSQMLQIAILGNVNFLLFQGLDEALTTGIVIGVGRPAHAGDYVLLLQQLHILPGGILQPAIGMMHQAGGRLALGQSPLQSSQGQSTGRVCVLLDGEGCGDRDVGVPIVRGT